MVDHSSVKFNSLKTLVEGELMNKLDLYSANVTEIRPGSIEVIAILDVKTNNVSVVKASLTNMIEQEQIGSLQVQRAYFVWREIDPSSTCLTPKVSITNLGRSKAGNAPKVPRSSSYIVQTKTVLNCTSAQKTTFSWSYFKINKDGNSLNSRSPVQGTKGPEWNIPQRSLDNGIYLIEFQVTVKSSIEYTSIALGFLDIVSSELVASISGGSKVTRGANRVITLDASPSQDPDVGPGNYTGMRFTWACKREKEQFPGGVPVTNLPVVYPPPKGKVGRGGCYDTGIGRLESSFVMLSMDTGKMSLSYSYAVVLTITKEGRNSTTQQLLHLVIGDPPDIAIKCLINCGKIVSHSARLSLMSSCNGTACHGPLVYQWTLQVEEDGQWSWIPDLQTKTETGLNSPGFVLKELALPIDKNYRVDVTVQPSNAPNGTARLEFQTNTPPEGGTCQVQPEEGIALETMFKFTCKDWTDRHLPLTYEFHYKSENGLNNVISYGHSHFVSNVLPSGPESNGSIIKVDARIIDSLSAVKTVRLQVTVTQARAVANVLKNATVGNDSDISKLLQSGEVRQATQLASAVLTTLDKSSKEDISVSDKKEIKRSIVDQVTAIEVSNLQVMTQVSSVLGQATDDPDQITLDTQTQVIGKLTSMTQLLKTKTYDNRATEDLLVNKGGQNLVFGLGNILRSASKKARNRKDPFQNENKNATKSSERLVENVGDVLLSRMVVDQNAYFIDTSSLSMALRRQRPESLTKLTLIEEGSGQFQLPPAADLTKQRLTFMDSQMVSTNFNPFTWDKTADQIDSHVVSLELKDSKGMPLSISNLKKEILISIPRVSGENSSLENNSYFLKPSNEGSMQYHKVDIRDPGSTLEVKIVPVQTGVSFGVYVRFGERPTVLLYERKIKIPNISPCHDVIAEGLANCPIDPHTLVVDAAITREPGVVFIGILYDINAQETKRRRKRSCSEGRRHKRSCIEPKDAPEPENITITPRYNPKTDVNYTISIQENKCLYWNKDKEKWVSTGCKVGPNSKKEMLQCACNHLSSFGGGLLVAPNPIDFDVVLLELTRLGETGNVAVLCTIILALLLYLLIVVLARRADKRDEKKQGPPIPVKTDEEATYLYELTVVTGVWKNSGTTANVAIVIHGIDAESEPITLSREMTPLRVTLARGNEDCFLLHVPNALGPVQYLRIWHDNSGNGPSWFLDQIYLKDLQTDEAWTFLCNRWLALEEADGKIDRLLSPISVAEVKSFSHSLRSRNSKNFAEGHLWLSIVTKPPQNTFTRVQRATCCLCILLSAMLANAMFYKTDKVADTTIKVGPLKFSWRQIIVGIESSLIVTPVNLLIAAIFKNVARRKPPTTEPHLNTAGFSRLCCSRSSTAPETSEVEGSSESKSGTKTSKREQLRKLLGNSNEKDSSFQLPHCWVYVAWIVSFITVATSAAFTFSYSLVWGKEIANQWLSSMLVSFTEDIFVLQPIKVCLVAFILACLFQKRVQLKKPRNQGNQAEPGTQDSKGIANKIKVTVPAEDELQRAREYRQKEKEMFSFGKSLLGYLIFITLLTIVCHGARSQHGFWMADNIKNNFNKFYKATDTTKFWKWLNTQYVPGIYGGTWYNNKTAKEEYTGDWMSIILGMPRLRQLRVKQDSCLVPKEAKDVTLHCLDFYSFKDEDKTLLSLPGWQPFCGNASWENATELCPKPWRYASPETLNFLPTWGYYGWYDGGGFTADLGYNQESAMHVISELQNHEWVDRQTRAVLIEFSIYNVNTGYLSACTFFYEMLPTGYGNVYERIDTLLLTSTQSGFYQFYLVCQLLFIIMVFYYVTKEAVKIFRKKCKYFLEPWNLIELSQVCLSLLVVVFYLVKSKHILDNVLKLKNNPFLTISFQKAVSWNDAENGILSIVVFITTVKLLRMIRFNYHISVFSESISVSKATLVSYSVILFVIFLAFAQLGNLLFGANLHVYSTFQRTLYSGLLMAIGGKMQLDELRRVDRTLGPLFGFSFMYLMAFIFINFFVAILNDSYEDVKSSTDKTKKEFEMADFIAERLLEILLGFKRRRKRNRVKNVGSPSRNYSVIDNSCDEDLRTDEADHEGHESTADTTVNRPNEKLIMSNPSESTRRVSTWTPEKLKMLKQLAQNPHRLRRLKKKYKNLAHLMVQADAMAERKRKVEIQKKNIKGKACPHTQGGRASAVHFLGNQRRVYFKLDNLLDSLERGLITEDIELAQLLLRMNCSTKQEVISPLALEEQPPVEDDDNLMDHSEIRDDGIDPFMLFKDRTAKHQEIPMHLKKRGINERLQAALPRAKSHKRGVVRKSNRSKLFFSYSYL